LKPIPNQFELVKAIPVKSFEELIELFDMTKWVKMKGDYVENMTDNCDLLVIGGYFGT